MRRGRLLRTRRSRVYFVPSTPDVLPVVIKPSARARTLPRVRRGRVFTAPPYSVGDYSTSVTLAGQGSLTVGQTLQDTFSATTLAGAGSLAAAATLVQPASATLAGAGSLTASTTQNLTTSVTLAGSGHLDASAGATIGATLIGAGSLVVDQTLQVLTASATFTGAGALGVGISQDQLTAATLTGAGSLLASPFRDQPAAATLTGAGSLTADGRRVHPAAAALTGAGSLTAAPFRTTKTAATLAGSGALVASAKVATSALLVVALWAVDPVTGALIPLPHATKVDVAPVRNGVGGVTVEYPAYGLNFDVLHSTITDDVDLEVEIWLGGRRQNPLRGYLNQSSGDEIAETSVWTFAGNLVEQRLDETLVYPQAITVPNGTADLAFAAKNAGTIALTILNQAQLRGSITDFARDFTTTTDSRGATWPTVVNISFSPGTTFLQVLQKMVDLDLCEFRVTADKVLQLYLPGTLGSDHTDDVPRPLVFRHGQNILDAPRKHSVKDSGTSVLMAGAQGVYRTADDATALARRRRRIEVSASANNLSDVAAVTAAAQSKLTLVTPGTLQADHGLSFAPGDPRPQADFDIGDWVYSDTGAGLERLRIAAWSLSVDVSGPTGTVTLNDVISDRLIRLKRQLDLITSGSAVVGTSTAPPVHDVLAPAAPIGVVASSSAYTDVTGQTLATLNVGWAAVNTNSDGSAADDVNGYIVQFAYTAQPTVWATGATVTDGSTTSTTFGNLTAGVGVNVRVAATDFNGNTSAWSSLITLTTNNDASAPPIPSTPVCSDYLGTLLVAWDGLGSVGQSMPPDFDHVEVHVALANNFTPTPATYRDSLFAAGTLPVSDLNYGTTYYARLIAVDNTTPTPNKSNPSGTGSSVPQQVVSADLFAGCVGSSKLADLAVITAKVDNLAVNDAKFGSGSVGKLTAGIFTAVMTLSGIIRTASTGARVEQDGAGIRVYNSSGTQVVGFPASGVSFVTGQFQTALTGSRLVMNPAGTNPDRIDFYPTSGSQFASIESATVSGQGAITLTGNNTAGTNGGTVLVRAGFAHLFYGLKDASYIGSEIYTDGITARMNSPIVDLAVDTRTGASGGNRVSFTMFDGSRVKIAKTQLNYWVTGTNEPWLAAVNRDVGFVFTDAVASGLNSCVYIVGNNPATHRDLRCFSVVYDGTVVASSSRKIKRNIRLVDDVDVRAATRRARAHRFEKRHQDEGIVLSPDGERLRGERTAPPMLGLIAEDMPAALQATIHGAHLGDTTPVLGIDMGALQAMTWHGLGDAFDDIDELRGLVAGLRGEIAQLKRGRR